MNITGARLRAWRSFEFVWHLLIEWMGTSIVAITVVQDMQGECRLTVMRHSGRLLRRTGGAGMDRRSHPSGGPGSHDADCHD
jgi:hypothetical protein